MEVEMNKRLEGTAHKFCEFIRSGFCSFDCSRWLVTTLSGRRGADGCGAGGAASGAAAACRGSESRGAHEGRRASNARTRNGVVDVKQRARRASGETRLRPRNM